MRILYVTQNYLPEMGAGPGRISEMAREWVASGHQVQVLAPVPNAPTGIVPPEYRGKTIFRETDSHGVEVVRTWILTAPNKGRVRRSAAFGSFAAMGVLTGATLPRPDIVIGSSPQLLAAVAGCGIAKIHRVPWVFEVRDLWPESVVAVGALKATHPIVKGLFKAADILYRDARRIVVVTERFREILMERGIDADKIAFVPNGVDISRFYPRAAVEEDRRELGGGARFIVSYIGTHGMAHDLGRLLEVAARMRNREDVAFAFVGDGAERAALQAAAASQGLPNVRFLGVQPRERIPALYAASDLCVVPLRRDDVFTTVLPSKIFEIMGMAKPILIAVDGEARQVVERSGGGRYVEPGNTEALQAAIEEMLQDSENLTRAGLAGREFVIREFDRRNLAARYLGVLQNAI